jgi:O-antigen/teichoic acid export membrane protein
MTLRKNLIANYSGSIITGLMSFIFIPVYVRLMGIEAYGLVGFFVTLQSVFAILDLGLSTTLNREFARLSTAPGAEPRQRTLLRSVETIYWLVAVLNGALVVLFAHSIAQGWVRHERLSVDEIARAIVMMGIVLLFQWPLGMYTGGLLGLQRQVVLNVINAVMALLRGVGAIVVLWLVAPTVTVFFTWQVLVSALHTMSVALALWRSIGGVRGASFERAALRAVWRFAAGMVGISLVATALSQIDKVIVSKLLPLSTFGYYAIAGTVAMSVYRIITPLFSTLFPRFAQLVAAGDEAGLAALYHRSCEVMSVIVLPAAIFLSFFSREILLLWTRDAVTANATHRILSILIIGTAMNGILNLPYAVQLAHGWTSLTFWFNVAAVIILAPMVYYLTRTYGVVGAATGWMSYNVAGALVLPPLMHRRLLRGELKRFYLRDVGAPLAAAVLVSAALRLVLRDGLAGAQLLAALIATAAAVQLASTAAARDIRLRVWSFVRQSAS